MNKCKFSYVEWITVTALYLILLTIVQDSSAETTIETIASENVKLIDNSDRTTLYKCESSSIDQEFIQIPSHLRIPPMENEALMEFPSRIYNFTLTKKQINCLHGFFDIKLMLTIGKGNKDYFTEKGFLKNNYDYFNPQGFCISSITESEMTVHVCLPECDNDEPCIPKCCPMGMKIKQDFPITFECQRSNSPNENWHPNFVKKFLEQEEENEETKILNVHPHYWQSQLSCPTWIGLVQPQVFFSGKIAFPVIPAAIDILNTGQIRIKIPGLKSKLIRKPVIGPWTQRTHKYCIDGLTTDTLDEDKFEPADDIVLMFCTAKKDSRIFRLIHIILLVISALVLLSIVIIYGLLWNLQGAHGWTVVTFCLCQFATSLTVIVTNVIILYAPSAVHTVPCIINGVMGHFFFLASFSWTIVIDYDLWSTIRSTASPRSRRNRLFLAYSCFGFGIPIFIVSLSIILDTQIGSRNEWIIKPQYGQLSCFLGPLAVVPYLAIPVAILFVLSIVFALLMAKVLWNMRGTTEKFGDSSSIKTSTSQIKMFTKFFVVMGLSSGLCIGGWFATLAGFVWIERVESIYNIFQVVLLFWIFVWKKQVRVQLAQKHKYFERAFERIELMSWPWNKHKRGLDTTSTLTKMSVLPQSQTNS